MSATVCSLRRWTTPIGEVRPLRSATSVLSSERPKQIRERPDYRSALRLVETPLRLLVCIPVWPALGWPRTPHEASGTCGITKIARWSTGAGRAAVTNQRAFYSVLSRCRALARVAATSSLGSLTCGDSNLRLWERPARRHQRVAVTPRTRAGLQRYIKTQRWRGGS